MCQRRQLHLNRAAAGDRIFIAMLGRAEQFIMHWRHRGLRKATAQAAIGVDRGLVGRNHEQDGRRYATAARFVGK